jgi:hypothetical protein
VDPGLRRDDPSGHFAASAIFGVAFHFWITGSTSLA